MDDQENEHEAGGAVSMAGRHLSKRARKNKGLVIRFDADARKDFVTGFHKRKQKRRKLAEKQKQLRERQKRLQERRERRRAMAEALGQTELEDVDEEMVEDRPQDSKGSNRGCSRQGTVLYEDEDVTTVVNTYSIELDTSLTDSKALKPCKVLSIKQILQKQKHAAQKKSGGHSKQRKKRL